MVLDIVKNPDPFLRQRSREILPAEITTPAFQQNIDDMIETMYAAAGIGIAGPQVSIARRVIIVETGVASGEQKPVALINPEIIKRSWRKVKSEEGCLSVPGIYGILQRSRSVIAKAWDRTGKKITIKDRALIAIILQHEIDHLDGILFIDKAIETHPVTKEKNPKI